MSTQRRHVTALALAAAALGLAGPAPAAPAPVRVAAFLWHESPNDRAAFAGFQAGLHTAQLDWDVRLITAEGDATKADAALASLRAEPPALLLALGTTAARRLRDGVPGVPIVFTAVTNPVETGIAAAWNGSGSRLAGNSNWLPPAELAGAFRAAVPGLRTLGIVRDPRNPVSRAEVLEFVDAVRTAEPPWSVRVVDVLTAESLAPAVQELCALPVEALWIPIDHLIYSHLDVIQSACDGAGIPIVTSAAAARPAAVLAVVADYHLLGLQAAEIARRIVVEGAAPDRLPVGRLRSFRSVVNLTAAARCRHSIPLAVLAGADEVIR